MRLLILTQAINPDDPILGFFVRWVQGLSTFFDRVDVVALRFVPTKIADNVFVRGVDELKSTKSRLRRVVTFVALSVRQINSVDVLFVHMIPEYVIAVGWLYRLCGKKVYLWYAHGAVTWKLRLATFIVNGVVSSSEAGFRISTPKSIIVGQGIDTDQFSLTPVPPTLQGHKILSIGRISASKHYEEMVDAVILLQKRGHEITLEIIGEATTEIERIYANELNKLFIKKGVNDSLILMKGAKTQREIPQYLSTANIFINLSDTGSLDKAVLEAMSSGVPVLTSNPAYFSVLSEKNITRTNDPVKIADKLEELLLIGRDPKLRDIVLEKHSFTQFSKRMGVILTS